MDTLGILVFLLNFGIFAGCARPVGGWPFQGQKNGYESNVKATFVVQIAFPYDARGRFLLGQTNHVPWLRNLAC